MNNYNSIKLKKKIEVFRLKICQNENNFIFEENQFDKFIGIIFNSSIQIFKFIFNVISKLIMKISSLIFNFILDQKQLKKRISIQEDILNKNIKLNSELSEQISQLKYKIDNLKNNNFDTFNKENQKEQNIKNDNRKYITDNKINKKTEEIEFYQKENLRISNELYETQNKFEIIKKEMDKFQEQRSNLIKKINSINETVQDSNVLTNVFENNYSSEKINIIDTNQPTNNKSEDIEDQIQKIFSK
tara:strand:- start:448 stop:1182 length:735 start_codon:yes stop_codon:yes gene_type:complete